MNIDGYKFRFIDTAGIRETSDTIENLGINKTLDKAENSNITLYVLDANTDISNQLKELDKLEDKIKKKTLIVVNKIDLKSITQKKLDNAIYISAKDNKGIKTLKKKLLTYIDTKKLSNNETIITNLRHYDELQLTLHEINTIIEGLKNGVTGDFLAINIRQALVHLGSITGEITSDTLLRKHLW